MIMHPYFLFIGVPLLALVAYWRWNYYKEPVYRFSSLALLRSDQVTKPWRKRIRFLLRLASLLALLGALARFTRPDERTKIPVKGVDIMLVLDTSGSMSIFDDLYDQRTRIDVARTEALKFIDKRHNDPIGLVIFSGVAVTRCPLTLDKAVLKQILKDTSIQTLKADGTVLSRAILIAANRLKKSSAKSKIMIVLTDGEPSAGDSNPDLSIELARKLGIKIYTIGIGSEKGGYINHPFYGLVNAQGHFNEALLVKFARETGGQFFQAQNPEDMEDIYKRIDALEKTDYETPLFARYFEYFMPFLWLALLILMGELILTCFVWVTL
ncbi:VWA domain-containing protein [Candidatus Dependentiae bacterium]|nr:VWA domain-containing protein [Candidatus Dependentiae bacterium]